MPLGVPSSGGIRRWALRPFDPDAPIWEDLRHVLSQYRSELGAGRCVAHVAIRLPALQVRRVDLPKLDEATLRRVVGRDIRRFFPALVEPQVVGLAPLTHRGAPPYPWLVAAAPAAWLDAVYSALLETGWRVALIVPAQLAWAAAAKTCRSTPVARELVMVIGGRIEAISLVNNRIIGIRRAPLPADRGQIADAILELLSGAGTNLHITLLSSGNLDRALAAILERPEISVDLLGEGSAEDELAAAFAVRTAGPRLLPEQAHARRHRYAVMRCGVALVTAVALLCGGASLRLTDLRREIASIEARREGLGAAVTRSVSERSKLLTSAERVANIGKLEREMPRWSFVFAQLSPHLPGDAHLREFRAVGDTVEMRGTASDALHAVEALRAAPGVSGIRVMGPIRREVGFDGSRSEQFDVSVFLQSAAASSRMAKP
jgi:hypothetical protein